MKSSEVKKMKKKLNELQDELVNIGPVMRGSVVVIGTKNKQPYFSLNKDKKTKMIYLGKKREPIAKQYSNNHKRLLKLVDEMTISNKESAFFLAISPINQLFFK
jgi:hypothetical protein